MTTTMVDREPLVLDIETVPLASALAMPYPEADRLPPSNYKSEDAIARWREADRAKWSEERVKECSLNPRLGRVVCLGLAGSTDCVALAPTEGEEAALLDLFWGAVKEAPLVVTWNGSWDLRFLVVRSIHHGIAPSVPAETVRGWFAKYRTHPHFDAKAVLLNWPSTFTAGEGLDEWAEFLGCEGKTDGISGADVYPMYERGHFDEIAKYCSDDVRSTHAIYRRVERMFR